MPLPRFAVRAAARAKGAVPESAWPALLAVRSLTGQGPILGPAPKGRILTLSAHPDDDTIGAAGTLALATQAGAQVTAVVATNGEASVGTGKSPALVGHARTDDARAAFMHLGIDDVRFLDRPDGALEDDTDLTALLAEVLRDVQPDVIFVPWRLDGHADHQALHQALLATSMDEAVELWCYETWAPLPPNRAVNITRTADRKAAALAAHETASEAFDITALAALSRYRSAHVLRGRGEAEAFLVMSPGEARALHERVAPPAT